MSAKLTNIFTQLKQEKYLVLIVGIFSLIFASISFVNHYNFRTFSLDLGLYTNALYDYAHLQFNDSTTFKTTPENLLADHFDLYLPLLSLFSYIFKSYTLLIFQWLSLIIGGIGVYQLMLFKGASRRLSHIAICHFFLFFGVYSALSFDYHSNVIASMIIPWFILAILKKQKTRGLLLLIAMLIAKENMSLILAFVTLGLALDQWKNKPTRNHLLTLTGICLAYFLLIIGFVMPALSNSNQYPHFHYSALGENGKDALLYLLQHPFDALHMLFTNHSNHVLGDYVKIETFLFLSFAGLPFLFKKPQYLIMLIPVITQKMFHDNPLMWSFNFQYNIEFAPIISIGLFSIIMELKSRKTQTIVGFAAVILTLSATIRSMDRTVFWTDKTRVRIYKSEHYFRNYDVDFVHKTLNLISDDAVISAQSPFVPHLALRQKIYEFPVIKDATLIVIHRRENPDPMTQEMFEFKTDSLLHSPDWSVKIDNGELLLLEKKK